TRLQGDWSSDVCSSDLAYAVYPESIKGLLSVLCSTYPALGTQAEIYAGAPCESLASALREHGYRTALFHSGRFGYLGMDAVVGRSEERRVGKGGRGRAW